MSHTRNAARFGVIIFWLAVVGLAFTAVAHSGNAFSLSWATWLFYAAISAVVLYAGFFVSKRLWSIK